jgi:6-pyruvoyltetrahydropterin/6-carboxytetrahydropterin synthase
MFEVGAIATFRAFHRMPGHPPPEGDRHPHDYRVEVVAERTELDDRGMVCDLDNLRAAIDRAAGRARDADLSDVCGIEAVTVEVLASWLHGQVTHVLKGDGAEVVHVRVWESDDAFGGIRAEVA